jgi:superfamily II DNA or RNA helicase
MPIVGDCVAEYMKHGENRKFLAFGCNVAHCEELQKQFLAAGIVCELYTYRTPDEARTQMVDEFRKPDSYIRGLISVAALAKGFDVSDVSCIIMARPLKSSLAEHIQILGRGLRQHDGKTECLVLDHAGNMKRFWARMHDFFAAGVSELDDGKIREKAKKPPKEPEPMKCPKCAAMHKPRPSCPACGFVYQRSSQIEHAAGTLTEVGGVKNYSHDQKQAWYSMLLQYARDRGFKDGYAAHKYKEKFGVWPRSVSDVLLEPTPEVMRWIRSRNIAWAKRKAA